MPAIPVRWFPAGQGWAGWRQVHALHPTGVVNPWHWLLADDPLRHGLTWHTWLPPLAATVVLAGIGLPRLARRDLH